MSMFYINKTIFCLVLMWKFSSGIGAKSMYMNPFVYGILPHQKKCCKRKCRDSKNHLLIDKVLLKDCKKRKTSLAMPYIEYGIVKYMDSHRMLNDHITKWGTERFWESRKEDRHLERWSPILTDTMHDTHNTDSCESKDKVCIQEPPMIKEINQPQRFYGWHKFYGREESEVASLADTVYNFSAAIRMEFVKKMWFVRIEDRQNEMHERLSHNNVPRCT